MSDDLRDPVRHEAIPLKGKPPCPVRRPKHFSNLFSVSGKMVVTYIGTDGHLYIRYGRYQWARVEALTPRRPRGAAL